MSLNVVIFKNKNNKKRKISQVRYLMFHILKLFKNLNDGFIGFRLQASLILNKTHRFNDTQNYIILYIIS